MSRCPHCKRAPPITVTVEMIEQPDFLYFECPECGFDSVQARDFQGSCACPLCAGDSGHDVGMRSRVCRDDDRPEGRDARDASSGD